MARRLWRTTTTLLALLMVLMGIFVFLFVGCGSDEDTKDTYDINEHRYYVVFDDGNGQTYSVTEGGKKTVYYEYTQGVTLKFTYKIYNYNNRMVVSYGLPSRVDLDTSGEKDINVTHYTKEHGTEWTILTVVVKEKPRLTPEVSFDPNGAISYIANEKYVYKYDGDRHYPYMLLSYNGSDLELHGSGVFTIEYKNRSQNNLREVIDVGVYIVHYAVADEYFYNVNDRGKYESVSMSIIVEIVE